LPTAHPVGFFFHPRRPTPDIDINVGHRWRRPASETTSDIGIDAGRR
jgi:hypothetical protein